METELDELYQTLIREHSKKPKNFGKIECHCHHQKGKNPSCGDEIDIYIDIDKNNIKNINFTGEGCALCIASTSILTETLKGKDIKEAIEIITNFIDFIVREHPIKIKKLTILGGVRNFPLRVKCVLLGWRTAESILINHKTV